MTGYRNRYGQRMPRRGIGSYDSDWQRPLKGDKTVEITVEIVRDNDRDNAILVRDGSTVEKIDKETGEITEAAKETWIPRSQIKGIERSKDGKTATMTVTEWIANKAGLI